MPAKTVSGEISHLIREKRFPQKRAVAAALNMQRAGKLRGAPAPAPRGARRSGRR